MDRYHACWQQNCHEAAWREAEQDYFGRVLIDKPENDRGYDYKNAASPVPWLASILINVPAESESQRRIRINCYTEVAQTITWALMDRDDTQ